MPRLTFDQITKEATTDAGMRIRDQLYFQFFNPLGVRQAQIRLDEMITAAVDKGLVKPGAIMAYGSMDDFSYKALRTMVENKSNPSQIAVDVAVRMYRERNERAAKFLIDLGVEA